MPDPIYTAENVHLAYQLRWSLAVFWMQPGPDADTWLEPLQEATEPDGVRVLEHRFSKPDVSQFLISTLPHVAPAQAIRSVKGRLQHVVRAAIPKAFHRNYSITSIGAANQAAINTYVAGQLQRHPMADPKVETILAPFQFSDEGIDLCRARHSGHGEFIYNLHLVVVHQDRFAEIRENRCQRTLEMVRGVAHKKGHLLSRVGLLVDHLHWTVGCGIQETPLEVGLSYLNNLAYAHEMQPIFQFGFYVGTFGPYDMNAVRRKLTHEGE